jgi:hypothetical protein
MCSFYYYFTDFRPTLGHKKLPMQLVLRAFSPVARRLRREDDHSPHLVPRSGMELSLHSPIHLYIIPKLITFYQKPRAKKLMTWISVYDA